MNLQRSLIASINAIRQGDVAHLDRILSGHTEYELATLQAVTEHHIRNYGALSDGGIQMAELKRLLKGIRDQNTKRLVKVADVTILTPAVAHRAPMLAECIDSVSQQTVLPTAHAIKVDHQRRGPGALLSEMLEGVATTWFVPLADDDLLSPTFIERLTLAGQSAGKDVAVIYPFCSVEGREGNPYNHPFDAESLRRGNYIPSTALVRTQAAKAVGGYAALSAGVVNEDHDLWLKLLEAGYSFLCVPEELWIYRFHGRNISTGLGVREI